MSKRDILIPFLLLLFVSVVFVLFTIAEPPEKALAQEEIIEEPLVVEEIIEEPIIEPEIDESPIETWYYNLSDDDRYYVFATISGEARGTSVECMTLIAETIRDRAITRKQTPTKVCLAKGQFVQYYGTVSREVEDKINAAIDNVFKGGFWYCENPITHFCTVNCHPSWEKSFEKVAVIDGVKFFVE